MSGYRELLEKEVIEAWRTHRLTLACALFLALGLVTPVLTKYLPDLSLLLDPTAELGVGETGTPDVVDLLVRLLVQFGALAGILLAMGSVAGERDRGTTGLVLVRPVARGAYLLAKLAAMAMVLALAIGLGVLAAWAYTGLLFGAPPLLGWIQLAMFAWLSAMVYAAITFAGSTVLRAPLGAAGVGVAALLVFTLASAAPVPNFWLPTALAEVARATALEEVGPELDATRTAAISGAIVVGSFAVAWLRFRREDL